jgi:hypothetical protein
VKSWKLSEHTCRWCDDTKHVSEFPRSPRGWVLNECLACRDERLRCWAEVDRSPVLAPGAKRWVADDATELICTRCGRMRPLGLFYTVPNPASDRILYRARCKQCLGAMQNNTPKRQEYRAKNARAQRDRRLRANFGITLVEYEERLADQGGRCAICGSTEAGGPTKDAALHVDHEDRDGVPFVRGLLCRLCNVGLGQFGDDVDRLMAAAAYLLRARPACTDWEPRG